MNVLRTRITLKIIGLIVLSSVGFARDSALDGPESCATDYAVKGIELAILQDGSRAKDLSTRVYYPDGDGPFPIVIFSHGNTSSKDKYPGVGRFLATKGYVSIHPTHSDSVEYWDHQGQKADWAKQSMWDHKRWTSRPRDISFVIDSLPGLAEDFPELKEKLDLERVAVAGHSFGGNTAQLIGGAKLRAEKERPLVGFLDERVDAIVALSAAGRGWVGLENGSWDDVNLPMLCVTGTKDFGPAGRHFEFRLEGFLLSPPGDKYQLVIQGMGHNFRETEEHFSLVKTTLEAFLDAYLKDDARARAFLRSEELRRASEGIAILSYR